ncbi:MAG: hypothetical protein FMNOHCHN_03581 [Ignavibacteriaceae bacterium]|nr:hypothetical protein [Ignavibacteriaceae bacterium]
MYKTDIYINICITFVQNLYNENRSNNETRIVWSGNKPKIAK